MPESDKSDIAASFQSAVLKALLQNTEKAFNKYETNSISLVGGVAANNELRNSMTTLATKYSKKIVIPELQFCGDNAAMIAFRGKTLFDAGRRDPFSVKPYPSLPKDCFQPS